MVTWRGWYAASRRSTSPAAWIALTPSQDRAEWARRPAVVTTARMVPWQPASTRPYVGSSRTARSARMTSGRVRASRVSPLRADSTSSQS